MVHPATRDDINNRCDGALELAPRYPSNRSSPGQRWATVVLARGDARQHVLLVRRFPRADDDRVNVGGLDQLLAALVWPRVGQAVSDRLRSFEVGVVDRGDAGARQNVGEPADVVLADHPDANDTDVDGHEESPFSKVTGGSGRRRPNPRPQATASARPGRVLPLPAQNVVINGLVSLDVTSPTGQMFAGFQSGGSTRTICLRRSAARPTPSTEFTRVSSCSMLSVPSYPTERRV